MSTKPVDPGVIAKEVDAHQASVEAFSSLWSWPDPGEMVGAADAEQAARRWALVHMLADLWRVVVSLPRFNADNTKVLAECVLKTPL